MIRSPVVVAEKVDKHGREAYETVAGRRISELAGRKLPWHSIHGAEPPKWSTSVARARVEWWLETVEAKSDEPFILLGRRVCAAFRLPSGYEWLTWYRGPTHRHAMIPFPHPSGLNRWWNEPKNEAAARDLLQKLAGGELPLPIMKGVSK